MDVNKINTANNLNYTSLNSDASVRAEVTKLETKDYTDGSTFKKDIKLNRKELDSDINKANKIFFKNNTHLQFKIHDETHDVIVKIIDDESGEIIKEIPPEKFIDMMAKICEVAGIFVDEKR